jgi:hypothetical protein
MNKINSKFREDFMKKKFLISFMVVFVIGFFSVNGLEAQVIGIQWNTFLGCLYDDYGLGIISDSTGNIYVTGGSDDTWGSPVNPHTGVNDILVFKLDASGNLLWHTFLGSSNTDSAEGITTDSGENIFIAGRTNGTWGTPILAYSGGEDTFVAKLNSTGSLLWNTFLGSSNHDFGYGIASDSAGNVYAAGHSYATWGSPLNPFDNFYDAFVAKLDTSGNLLWHTFVGGGQL